MENKVKRVLWLSDFACASGFANVAQNILAQVAKTKKYAIDVVGINYYGVPNDWQKFYPAIRLLPASVISNGDLFGRMGFLNLLNSGVYDIVFTLQDTFIIETIGKQILEIRKNHMINKKKTFKWIYYYPIDAEPPENWIKDSVAMADYPVSYTEYGKRESIKKVPELESKLRVIPHGVDTKVFFPLSDEEKKEFRSKYFKGKADGKFLITNVNRNQPRKDLMRTLQMFHTFQRANQDAGVLYLHCKREDVGGNIYEIARRLDLDPDVDFILPAEDFNEHDGYPTEVLNAIYNVSDVVITTTMGEGWGLSMTEAMACKTAVVAPDHTSLSEILADGRGTLVGAGKRLSEWQMQIQDNERIRPVVDVGEFMDKVGSIYRNREIGKKTAETAYNWIKGVIDWEIVGEEWRKVFAEAEEIKKAVSIGRNDPCHCGSGKKYKNCHLQYE